jgi:Uma2 family endonuclease
MSMPDLARRWTREEWLALPEDDGYRYELLDGELLVTPSPLGPHQRAVWALWERVHPYVKQHRLGLTGLAPSDLDLRSGQALQPDLFVVPFFEGREPLHWHELGIPRLLAEVLSPSTAMRDRNQKRRRYQASGVAEYWIVDTDARLIERWQPDDLRPEILTERLAWQPEPGIPPLTIELGEYFRQVWAEA